MSVAANIIAFINELTYDGPALPPGIRMMNPYRAYPQAMAIAKCFYENFYSDNNKRLLILGINPGRFGSGRTGIPFTDPKRLPLVCDIPFDGPLTHEPSSVFIYDMIAAYGGPAAFYQDFYIGSVCPLGLVTVKEGKETNLNYYDNTEVHALLDGFIIDNIKKQAALGMRTDICFCLGTGRNETVLRRLNDKHHFFKPIIALEHPRYFSQYKSRYRPDYIEKHLSAFGFALSSRKSG